jgi:uncharacterized membrane protein YoaK (UPF0700 family)
MSIESTAAVERVHSDRNIRDWLLFALTVSSGAVDSISFVALGKVFTAFMTGNIAFLGLGIALVPNAPSVVTVLVPMAGFGLGIYFATIVVTPRKMARSHDEEATHITWPRRTTLALAASLLPHLGFVVLWIATGRNANHENALGLLGLWAIAMGMQSAAVRRLNVGGVFTTAATATFIFLVGDFANEPITPEERVRLTGVLASLVIGATAGGILIIHAPTYAPIFPFIITAIVVVLAVKAFGHRDPSNVVP